MKSTLGKNRLFMVLEFVLMLSTATKSFPRDCPFIPADGVGLL
jgi:hypothetical protein